MKNQIEENVFDENLFYIPYGNDKYIFGLIPNKSDTEIDIFAIKTIYDSIIDLDNKIRFSFDKISYYSLSDNPMDHKPFSKPNKEETESIYYVENIIFRTSILWDMLAQLCNLHWNINKETDEINYKSFFNNRSQGKRAYEFAIEIMSYFNEQDQVNDDLEPWEGNHKYVKEFRNKITHRNSPNISTLSSIDIGMRPPVIFLLKRVIEDYLKVIYFIQLIIEEIINSLNKF